MKQLMQREIVNIAHRVCQLYLDVGYKLWRCFVVCYFVFLFQTKMIRQSYYFFQII